MKKSSADGREINPRHYANFFSIVTFLFTRSIFKKGLKRGIQEWDIYEILDSFRSEKLGERMQKEWEKQKKKKRPTLPLLACLFSIFGSQYLLYGFTVFIIKTILMVTKPLAIGKVVSYFDPNKTHSMTRNEGLMYAGILLLAIFLSSLFMHNYVFYIQQMVMKMKIAICGLIYRKSLRLSTPALMKFTSGQAVTLMTKDVACFDMAIQYAHDLWIGLIHMGIMTYMIYMQIGVSAFVGVVFLIILVPIQGCLGRLSSRMRLKTASKTDKRLRFTQEILNAIKIIKLYTWENIFESNVSNIRREEVTKMKFMFYIRFVGLLIGGFCSKISLCLCIILYAALGNHITTQQAFVVLSCFQTLRQVLTIHLPLGFAFIADMMAAVKRITEFLNAPEAGEPSETIDKKAVPTITHEKVPVSQDVKKVEPTIELEKVSALLDANTAVLKNICLEFKPGLNIITGSVGSGKSFLLKLLMNEISASTGTVKIEGEKSYSAQDPWLFPETVRENILFYKPYKEERYQEVLRVCALRKDIALLPQKDATTVIDKGLNLSRGQQARINLARAVYHEADIYLLDDSLSAVDTHVCTYIFEECIKKFLKDKICILITHNIQHLKQAQHVVVLDEGKVEYDGSYNEMPKETLEKITQGYDTTEDDFESKEKEERTRQVNEREEAYEDNTLLTTANDVDTAPISPTSIYQENQQEGKVPWVVYKKYLLCGGGVWTFLLLGALYVTSQTTSSWSDTFIREWVNVEPKLSILELKNRTNSTEYEELYAKHDSLLKQYVILLCSAITVSITQILFYFAYNARIGLNLHNTVMDKVLKGRMLFFDKNLSGNILNRFSRDIGVVDEVIPFLVQECIRIVLLLSGTLVVISTVNWMFIAPSGLLIIFLYLMRILYLRTGRGVQRLEGITRSPVVGHVNASMEGLLTIRSNRAQEHMKKVFDSRQNLYYSASYMVLSTSRAFGLLADLTTFFYVMMIIMSFFFISTGALAGNVGLAITQSFMLTGVLQWGICRWADLETRMTSVERLLEYESIETEDNTGQTPESWPNQGRIEYKNVTLRYSKTDDPVLKNISFVIEPKQKIGIVGRTGAGKSSIISVLFKLYSVDGEIIIDGKDIRNISNELVRSHISIIPQDPVLFSGSLRSNLDPGNINNDKDIWDALEEVEMKKIISNMDNGLESEVPEGGSNFSVGQRQLICLARAILRNNRILILDEATANVDHQTDALIQRTVRMKFRDCTVVTIAHRLHSIVDSDKVMVIDGGKTVEFDTPRNLKSNTDSLFYKMLRQAGLA